jgi:hypothetical protein
MFRNHLPAAARVARPKRDVDRIMKSMTMVFEVGLMFILKECLKVKCDCGGRWGAREKNEGRLEHC